MVGLAELYTNLTPRPIVISWATLITALTISSHRLRNCCQATAIPFMCSAHLINNVSWHSAREANIRCISKRSAMLAQLLGCPIRLFRGQEPLHPFLSPSLHHHTSRCSTNLPKKKEEERVLTCTVGHLLGRLCQRHIDNCRSGTLKLDEHGSPRPRDRIAGVIEQPTSLLGGQRRQTGAVLRSR